MRMWRESRKEPSDIECDSLLHRIFSVGDPYKGTAGSGVNPLTKIIDIVALSETLDHDFCFATQRVSGSVLCPLYVPKGIHQSQPKQRKPVQTRLEDILPGRNPSAMFAEHPEARQQREEALRGS